MSVNEFDKGGGGGSTEDGGRRSRALSCRPGSQIRRGLKSGVDRVWAFFCEGNNAVWSRFTAGGGRDNGSERHKDGGNETWAWREERNPRMEGNNRGLRTGRGGRAGDAERYLITSMCGK